MALPNGIHSTQELLHAHAYVTNHIYNFIKSMSLKCAVQLGIPDIIRKHARPITLLELMDALPAIDKSKSHCIERLMRILVHLKLIARVGISDEEKDTGYWLTPASILLVRDEPLSMAPFALGVLDPILTDPFHRLGEWFKCDDPTPFVTANGRTFWEQVEREPKMSRLFNECMASDTFLVASVIVRECRHVFEGLKTMVDVGGGTGTLARSIADAFGPGLKCSVLELPYVVAGLEGTENLTFVEGDMFESIPPADAVLMKCVLHDWCDEDCIKILRKCKQAIPDKGGKVIIVDMVVDDEREHENEHEAMTMETKLCYDIEMMMVVTGRERTEKEWAKLFHHAGFTGYKVAPVLGLRSLIEVFP